MSSQSSLDGVSRAMKVLDCFSSVTPELRLTDISNRLGMNKPQVQRILRTLERGGYLERNEVTKRYYLGIRIFQLGIIAGQHMSLPKVARPILERLANATQETVRLVALTPQGAVCVELIESPHGVRVHALLGAPMPWNAGTSGKVLLAFMDDDSREHILRNASLTRFNQHTVTDRDKLREEVMIIREQGYHVNKVGDMIWETRGIAAPIFDANGRVLGTASVTAPRHRMGDAEVDRFTVLVRAAACEISSQLGFESEQTGTASDLKHVKANTW